MRRTWALLALPVLLVVACISFDVEEDFCANVDPARRAELCGQAPGASVPDAGSHPPCDTSSQCVTPPGPCHEVQGTCVSGECEYRAKKAGVACDDGELCTVNDTCDGAGQCSSGTAFVCDQPPSQCHEARGTCANNTCSYPLKRTGTSCNDGNACTESDKCGDTGVCAGTAKACNSPPDQCYQQQGTCTASSGACVYPPQPNGTSCAPPNRCEVGACNGAGACAPTGPVTCDSTPCKTATGCEPSTGCIFDEWCARINGVCSTDCCRDTSGQCVAGPPVLFTPLHGR